MVLTEKEVLLLEIANLEKQKDIAQNNFVISQNRLDAQIVLKQTKIESINAGTTPTIPPTDGGLPMV